MTYNTVTRVLTVTSTSISDSGTYIIRYNATLNDAANSFNEDLLITVVVTDCQNEVIAPIQ